MMDKTTALLLSVSTKPYDMGIQFYKEVVFFFKTVCSYLIEMLLQLVNETL